MRTNRPQPPIRSGHRPARRSAFPRREGGGFAVMTAALIVVILGMCGMAIDFARMYNRKAELQILADAMALAAAAELDGTTTGLTRAATAAADAAARNPLYDYNASFAEYAAESLSFGAAPVGPWLDASTANAQAANLFYARVDTTRLDPRHGRVNMLLLPVLSSSVSLADIGSRSVAGRSSINVLPLAICAMTDTPENPGVARGDELVEYGFRRGVSYNLMRLNPGSTAEGANFLVNPFAAPGASGTSLLNKLGDVAPFICTGTMAMPRVTGGNVTVDTDFPLASLFSQLNSRFGTYTAPCTEQNAPPDSNIKPYAFADSITWMNDKPSGQSAQEAHSGSKLLTIADLAAPDKGTKAEQYGPLWIYAKAAKYASYIANSRKEPANGYATFDASDKDWATLYTPGSPKLKGAYPAQTPSKASTTAPGAMKSMADRRVLHIPLLRCPVPAATPASAEVLGVGRFYMTVPATKDDLFAEFAGLVRPGTLTGQVELYQ